MRKRILRLILGACAVLVIAYVILSNVSGVTGIAPMLAMPVVVVRDGALVQARDVRSFQYQFSEAQTSFEPNTSLEGMKDARVYGEGFLVEAPFTRMRAWMFDRTTISPQYRSLRIRLVFRDGTALSLALPVLSDTALNRSIQIDIQSAKAE